MTAEVTTIAVATGAAGAATAVVAARRPATTSGSVLVRAGIAVAVLSLIGVVVLLPSLPLGAFAVAHLLYLVAVLSVPLTALGLLVATAISWPARRWLGVVALVLLLPAPLGVWSTHIAPFRLREDRVDLALAPDRTLGRPLRIGVLSDLQNTGITGYERTAVDRLMAQDPDIVLIAGDLFQGDARQLEATLPAYRSLLRRTAAAPGGSFVVPGDVDDPNAFSTLVDGTGVVPLRDEVTATEVDGQRVVIGGVQLDYDQAPSQEVYDQLEAISGSDPVVLLAHRPDAVSQLAPRSRVDLTVAGHTHGGQIALPVVGPPVTLSDLPRSVGAGGLHTVDGNPIYVSTGVGVERGEAPQVRFLTRPSFGIVEVRPG